MWCGKQNLEVKVGAPCEPYEKFLELGKAQHEGTK